MFKNIRKIFCKIDILLLEKVIIECSKNNVKKLEVHGRDSIEITYW